MNVRGKVISHGIREGVSRSNNPFRHAWVLVKDERLGELVEITTKLQAEQESPFALLQTGQHVAYNAQGVRLYNKTLTADLVLNGHGDSAESARAAEDYFGSADAEEGAR